MDRPRVRLEILTIAEPCPADFANMMPVDGDRVRHCRHCRQDVYDLSALTREAAERLVADRLATGDGHLCVRLVRRADDTVVTADCRGAWRASAARWAARRGGAVGAALSVVLAVLGCDPADPPPTATMGAPPPLATTGMIAPPAPTTRPATAPATRPALGRMMASRPPAAG